MVAGRAREDKACRIWSSAFDEMVEFSIDQLARRSGNYWGNFVIGVVKHFDGMYFDDITVVESQEVTFASVEVHFDPDVVGDQKHS